MAYYLLYDENCSLCVRFMQAVKRRDRRGRIEPVGFQDFRIPTIVPLMTRGELENSFHLVFPDGKVKSGPQAMPHLLELLPSMRLVGWLLRIVPGSEKISEWIYARIAAYRK